MIPIFVTLCSYVHRVGRTARAGREGYAVTFVPDNDRSLLKAIVSLFLLVYLVWFEFALYTINFLRADFLVSVELLGIRISAIYCNFHKLIPHFIGIVLFVTVVKNYDDMDCIFFETLTSKNISRSSFFVKLVDAFLIKYQKSMLCRHLESNYMFTYIEFRRFDLFGNSHSTG